MTAIKGCYTLVTAKRKINGSGYGFKRKTYRSLGWAVKFFIDHNNEYDNIYIVDEHDRSIIIAKRITIE